MGHRSFKEIIKYRAVIINITFFKLDNLDNHMHKPSILITKVFYICLESQVEIANYCIPKKKES